APPGSVSPERVGTGVPEVMVEFVGTVVASAAMGPVDGTALGCGFGSSNPPDGTGSCGSATTIVGRPVRCGNKASSTYVTASTAKLPPSTERAQRRGGTRLAAGNHAMADPDRSMSA